MADDERRAEIDEEFCPIMEDGTHCEHWWDGEKCHACDASPMTEAEKIEQGMVEGPRAMVPCSSCGAAMPADYPGSRCRACVDGWR